MNHRQNYFEANITRPIIMRRDAFWTPVRVALAATYVLAFIVLWWVI